MISTSQREHLTYTAIGQSLIIFSSCLITWQYIIPGLSSIDTSLEKADKAVSNYSDAYSKGYEYGRLSAILTEMGNKDELLKIIQATPAETKEALIKVDSQKDYVSWLKGAINASDEDRKKLTQAKKKINSILPTMSPISSNIDEDNITLKEYTRFIEAKIIKQFNLDSNMAIGIAGLNFGTNGNGIPSSIGMFDLRLDFKAPNKDVKRFIDFVNTAGDTSILTQSGLLSEDQIPDIMSNPLITMEAFSLQSPLDMTNPDKLNSGRATIRFYVRGASKDDINYLKESLKNRKEDLQKRIDGMVTNCESQGILCADKLPKYKAFQQKYTDFTKGLNQKGDITGVGVETIYTLSEQVNSLRVLENEFAGFNSNINQ